jgi:hypothetical protein
MAAMLGCRSWMLHPTPLAASRSVNDRSATTMTPGPDAEGDPTAALLPAGTPAVKMGIQQ